MVWVFDVFEHVVESSVYTKLPFERLMPFYEEPLFHVRSALRSLTFPTEGWPQLQKLIFYNFRYRSGHDANQSSNLGFANVMLPFKE